MTFFITIASAFGDVQVEIRRTGLAALASASVGV